MKRDIHEVARGRIVQHLLVAILAGVVIVGFGFSFLQALLQFFVHSVAYILDDSYRIHTTRFGGYSGYIQTQLIPRVEHLLLGGWYTKVLYGILAGILIGGVTILYKATALRRLAFTIVFLLWIGWHEARRLVLDPFWTAMDIIIWLVCFGLLMYILSSWPTFIRQESDNDA